VSQPRKVLVTGATGSQGGAVAQALLDRGHEVSAYVRNAVSPAAAELAGKGATLIEGDLDDPARLREALVQVDTFFLMGTPFESGVDAETKQGIALADAAKSAQVGHVIYSSVASADKSTGIPHFESKHKIEQHLADIGVPYSVSGPVYFMENALAPWNVDALKAGKVVLAMPSDIPLQQISTRNIGDFVASLTERRERVFGQRFDIVGDELTGDRMAEILSASSGADICYEGFPASVLKEENHDLGVMFEWFVDVGYDMDLKALHREFSDVPWQSYSDWARSQDYRFLTE